MMSLAIPAVWAGVSFSKPEILTGTNFPANSICGGLPGLKIRSLTLSDARSISRKIAMKLRGGGVEGWLVTFGRSLLMSIQELFTRLARQKIMWKNKLLFFHVHQSIVTPARGQQKFGPRGGI